MDNLFISKYKFLNKRRVPFFCLLLLITGIFIWLASSIRLSENVADFMPTTEETERLNFVDNNIAAAEKIIISISNSDTTLNATQGHLYQWADILVDSIMAKGEEHISDIMYEVDDEQTLEVMEFVLQNLPYYLDENDYARIDTMLTPEKIKSTLEANRRSLTSPAGFMLKSMLPYDPLLFSSNALLKFSDLQVDNTYSIADGHILSQDKKSLMIFISSKYPVSETANNKKLVDILEQCYADILRLSDNDITLSSFGAAAVGVTNATQIKRDSYLSMAISLCLIIILLGLFFKKPAPLYMILFPVIFGGLFAIAMLFIIKDSISAIVLGAGSAIFGIAINYSLHFFVHYKETQDIETTIKDLATPMITGSITTIGAFLSLLIIPSKSLHDFGLFASFTLVGALSFVLIAIPIILSVRKISFKPDDPSKKSIWVKIAEYRPENKRWLVIATIVLTIIFSFFSGKVKFDSDLNNINYMTDEQRLSFNELSGYTTLSRQTDYLIAEGKTPYEALREFEKSKELIDSMVNLGKVKGYMSVGAALISDSTQKRRTDMWNSFWATHKDETIANISKYGTEVGFNSKSFEPFFEMIDSTFAPAPFDHFELFSDKILSDMIINTPDRSMIVTMVYSKPKAEVNPATLIPAGSNNFIYDRKNFSDSLVGLLMNDFNKVLWVCSFIVLAFLTISFGRLELSLLSFIPMLISWLWITAIMAITGISFNIVNIILATFIFGLGDDYSIFITEGLMQDYSRKTSMLDSYKVAVLLSALTMFIGIGTLVLAKHPAMKSLGIVTIIGMISVVLISYIVAPYLFNLLIKKKGEYRTVPVTIGKLLQTVFSFLGFMIFSLLLTIIGFFLLTIGRPTKKNKMRFHKCLCWVIKNVTGLIPGVKSNIINEVGETFDKPAVIICNHQAHIDLAYMMLMSPKVVILTNEWVWNCPFYGRIVKYADFYPVANGIESSVEKLSTLVDDGYSILVFPEGTRSADCSIQRFHKGAFYLAEKLNLDILPVLIHGIGHCLPKKEFLLRKGTCTVKIYDRVHPDDDRFGIGYVERTKNFKRFYEKEYDTLAANMETAEYNKDKVIHNYIYKGALIELNVRKRLKDKSALQFVNNLPSTGDILFVNCGNGEIPLLASLTKSHANITAIETDEEAYQIAVNCVSVPKNLTYHNTLSSLEGKRFDMVVLINQDIPSDNERLASLSKEGKIHII